MYGTLRSMINHENGYLPIQPNGVRQGEQGGPNSVRRYINPILLWLLAAVAGAQSSVSIAAESRFEWPGWQIPGQEIEERGALQIVADEEAESEREVAGEDGKKEKQKCSLQQRVTRRAIAQGAMAVCRTPEVKWADVVPGVYRVSARVKFDGDTGLIGTPIRLAVQGGVGGVARDFTATDFRDANTYEVISLLYEVSPRGDKRRKARQARSPWRATQYLDEVYPNSESVRKRAEGEAATGRPTGFSVEVMLPLTKYRSYNGMPPNSLRWARVDWIKLEKVQPSPSITVRHVRSDKLWLRPGTESGFEVSLENFTLAAQERTLALVLERGLNERKEIHRAEIALAPGAARVVHVPWQTDANTPLWGYRVVAEIRNAGAVEHSAADYFVIHRECYGVHISGSNMRRADPFRYRETYRNHSEVFGATSGDMARILPKHDAWISGMSGGNVVYTYKTVRAATEHNKKEGILNLFYLFAGGTGTPFMDLYVEHPEWATSKATATDPIYRIRREREEAVQAWDWEKKGWIDPPGAMTPGIECGLNHRFPELQERIETETLEFVRRTGYEGIRFDVGMLGPNGGAKTVLGTEQPVKVPDPMKRAAENFNRLRARVEAVYPDFEWGANMDTYAYLDTIKDRDTTFKPPEKYPEFIAFCRANGMFMDEGTMSAPFYDHYMNKWEDCWYFMNLKRKLARKHGGVYQLFSPHRDGTGYFCHDDIYFTLMTIASGSHYVGSYSAPPYTEASMGEFATRFAEFFWSYDLQPVEDAENTVVVDAPADIWYADGVTQQDIGAKRRYVIPLINPPVVDRMRRNKANELPPPIEEAFNIEITIPDGFSKGEAWMLTWEPRVMTQKLPATVDGEVLRVEFPQLQLFRTLVVEFAR